MVSDLELRVIPEVTAGARIHLQNEFQVYGRLGSMGHNVVRRRSEELMNEFAENLRVHLSQVARRGVV